MKLSVMQMLIGSLPHGIPITMVVFAGGMMMKTGDANPIWQPLSDVFVAMATLIYPILLVLGLVVIWETTDSRRAEIQAMPDDDEVKILDERKEELVLKTAACIAWPEPSAPVIVAHPQLHVHVENGVPGLWKAVLLLSFLCAHTSTLIFAGAGKQCFEAVDLLTNTTLPPFNGEIHRIVKAPLGYVSNAIWIVGVLLYLLVFRIWASSRQKPLLAAARVSKERLAEIVHFVDSVPLLTPLSKRQRAGLACQLESVDVLANEIVVVEGEVGHAMYFVESGALQAETVAAEEQGNAVVKEYAKGDFFGELALLNDTPRAATVRAKGAARCLKLEKRVFEGYMQSVNYGVDYDN